MVDRCARDKMADAIEGYLDDRLTAFQFDDAIDDVARCSDDEAVKEARKWLWFSCDDFHDHKIVADKGTWDTFYRILLLLRSDADFQIVRNRSWNWVRIVPSIGLISVALLFAGFAWAWFPVLLSLVVLLAPISRLRSVQRESNLEDALFPFASVQELLRVRKSVRTFAKKPFPHEIAERHIRPSWLEWLMTFTFFAACLTFSVFLVPLLFLWLAYPHREESYVIIPAHQVADAL